MSKFALGVRMLFASVHASFCETRLEWSIAAEQQVAVTSTEQLSARIVYDAGVVQCN